MSELFVKKENLFEESRILLFHFNKIAGDELFSFRTANNIFSQIFAVLNFCFFSFKRKEVIPFAVLIFSLSRIPLRDYFFIKN